MSQIIKTILILFVVGVLFGGVYFVLSRSGYFDAGMKTAEDVRNMTDKLEQDILADLARIDAISLDDGVFENREFKALVDTAIDVKPQPVSRPNPFGQY